MLFFDPLDIIEMYNKWESNKKYSSDSFTFYIAEEIHKVEIDNKNYGH